VYLLISLTAAMANLAARSVINASDQRRRDDLRFCPCLKKENAQRATLKQAAAGAFFLFFTTRS
jgi:hypothetical protein